MREHSKIFVRMSVLAQKDAAATIIFRSGKKWRLFEGGYYLKVATIQGMRTRHYCLHII